MDESNINILGNSNYSVLSKGAPIINYEVVSTATEINEKSKKRTFEHIRLLILSTLISKRKTINQIAKDIDVNWKTVENHLTYLMGKKLIKEVFSSKYVRIFEIADLGSKYMKKLKDTHNNINPSNTSTTIVTNTIPTTNITKTSKISKISKISSIIKTTQTKEISDEDYELSREIQD